VNADESESQKLIDAFGVENREGASFDWNLVYGPGFDVLNMKMDAANVQNEVADGDKGDSALV
jgi:hypothetical protein